MIISVVGKSGSGKSSISRILKDLDDRFMHIDIDEISHYVLTIPDVFEDISNSFGDDVLTNGEIDRKKLGRIVFESSDAMDKLTEITWPYMEKIIDKIISNNKDKIILLDWILLPKTKYFENSFLKIWVDAPFEDRVKRVIKRSGGTVTYDYFLKRDKAGINYEDNTYDIFLENRDINKLRKDVEKVYEKCIVSR